jgi:hypothetical protein
MEVRVPANAARSFDAVPKSGSGNPEWTCIARSGVRSANHAKPVCTKPLVRRTLSRVLASHLVPANVNPALVNTRLGQESTNSTMRYVAVSDQKHQG